MSSLRFTIIPAMLVVAALACAAPASATDFCVAPNTSCGGTNVGDLQTAFDWAALSDNADRIFLGAATYTAPMSGFSYDIPTGPVEIIGAGQVSTFLTAPAGGATAVLKVLGAPGTSAHDLRVVLPQNVATNAIGIDTNAVLDNVEVLEDPTQSNARLGVLLVGAQRLRRRVSLNGKGPASTTAAGFDAGAATLRHRL